MQRPSDEVLDFFSNVLTIRNHLETDLASPPTRQSSRQVTLQLNQLYDLLSNTIDLETKCDRRLINFILATLMPVLQWIKSTPKEQEQQQQQRYNNVIEAWLKCINVFLSRTYWTIESPTQLIEQLVILFTNFMIHATKTEEEIQHLAVQCMKTTLSKLTDDNSLIQSLRDLKFRPQMAGSVSALLDIIRKGDALQLRIDAMHTLSTLVLNALGQVDSVAVFLPGIASALGRTIYQKQEKENQQILSTSLEVLGNVIVFVMRDECAPDFIVHKINSLHDLLSTTPNHNSNNDNNHINKDKEKEVKTFATNDTKEFVQNFYTTTKKKIKEQLDFIFSIKSYNTDWRVRLAMVRFAGKLLIKCSQTLDNCTSLLLKMVVLFIDDEYIQVATEAQLQIREIMQVPVFEQTIIPTLKENLADSINSIPRILINGDEGDKVTTMTLVTGYVLILGNRHAQGVLDSTITKTLDGWLAAFQIDQGGLNVLDENAQSSNKFIEFQKEQDYEKESSKDPDSTNTTTCPEQQELSPIYPKVRFKYLVADRTTAQAGRMLNVIGRYGNLSFWLDLLMDCFREQELDIQPQAAYMIHSLLSGAATEEIDTIDPQFLSHRTTNAIKETFDVKNMALHVLHEIVLLVIDPIITTVDHTTSVIASGGRQFHKLKKELETAEILATCFGLQIVGLTASILEAESIQDELITLLYPLLAHLGSPNVFIHNYALITLNAIALVCNKHGGGAQQLAVENIDYIINMVSQRISVLEDNLRAPLVLKALIRIGGPKTIDYLEDTVEEIFDALDGYHMDDWSCAQLCSVLAEIVRVVYRKNTISLETGKEHDDSSKQQEEQESMDKEQHKISKEISNFIKLNKLNNKKENDDDRVNQAPKSMEEIGRYFLDQQQKKDKKPQTFDPTQLIPGYEDANGNEGNDDEEIKPPDDTPEPLSRAQQMTLDIMNKSRHFLTASSPQLRVEMLGLFSAGTKVLASRLDKLGVLVNEAWPHIIQRLSDKENNMVILEAITIIGSIAESLHDFISNRVKDFWPKFKELLKQGRNESYHYSAYSYIHRLHNAILVTLKSVIDHCVVRATQIPEMMDEIKWYLDERLHVELQQSAIHVFSTMSKKYPDTVWLYMLSLVSHEESTIIDETGQFNTFVIPEWMTVKEPYYRRNARHILSLVPAR
ncbi:armadillo-type protein [Circinella umbellata]|nr:armadillo-type protein [Circinella umbellata]